MSLSLIAQIYEDEDDEEEKETQRIGHIFTGAVKEGGRLPTGNDSIEEDEEEIKEGVFDLASFEVIDEVGTSEEEDEGEEEITQEVVMEDNHKEAEIEEETGKNEVDKEVEEQDDDTPPVLECYNHASKYEEAKENRNDLSLDCPTIDLCEIANIFQCGQVLPILSDIENHLEDDKAEDNQSVVTEDCESIKPEEPPSERVDKSPVPVLGESRDDTSEASEYQTEQRTTRRSKRQRREITNGVQTTSDSSISHNTSDLKRRRVSTDSSNTSQKSLPVTISPLNTLNIVQKSIDNSQASTKSQYPIMIRSGEDKGVFPIISIPKDYTFICPFCFKCFKESRQMIVHLKDVHESEMPAKSFKTEHKSASGNKQAGSEVIPTHVNGKLAKNTCPVCSKTLSSSCKLKIHIRIHTGERPFRCSQCKLRFISKFSLQRHIANKHQGDQDHKDYKNPSQNHEGPSSSNGKKTPTLKPCFVLVRKCDNLISKNINTALGCSKGASPITNKTDKDNQSGALFDNTSSSTDESDSEDESPERSLPASEIWICRVTTQTGKCAFQCMKCNKIYPRRDYAISHLRKHRMEEYNQKI